MKYENDNCQLCTVRGTQQESEVYAKNDVL